MSLCLKMNFSLFKIKKITNYKKNLFFKIFFFIIIKKILFKSEKIHKKCLICLGKILKAFFH